MKSLLNKSFFGLKLYSFLLFGLVALVGLIVGSIMDKDISLNLATQGTPFGMLFESWGELFCTMLGPIGAGIIAKASLKKGNKGWIIAIGIAVSVVTVAATTFFNFKALKGSETTAGYGYTIPSFAAILIALAINLGLFAFAFFFANKEEKPMRLLAIGFAIIVSFALFQGVYNIIKILAARPRFRFLVWQENQYSIDNFRAWWEWSFLNKLDSGGNGDLLKSFPSGHTGGVAVFITLPWAFMAFKKTKDNEKVKVIGVLLAFAFTVTMAFARVINGAHFLSDTAFAVLLAVIVVFLVSLFAQWLYRKMENFSLVKGEKTIGEAKSE